MKVYITLKWMPYLFMTVVLFSVVSASPLLPKRQVSGAIFTSNADGSQVNGNIYNAKTDVYLNGGPPANAPCSSGGLPDDNYYFQVTNPSGSLLLSTDAIDERAFTVTGGVITAYLGSTHVKGTGVCSSVSIALAPFSDTDNSGGEYKVWVTPQKAYNPSAGTFGFSSSDSKTDNFKVASSNPPPTPPTLTVEKYYDANANGVKDSGESTISGWSFTITDSNGQAVAGSPFLTPYSTTSLSAGVFTVAEKIPTQTNWKSTTSQSVSVTLTNGQTSSVSFGNLCLGAGGGLTIGYWSNKGATTAANYFSQLSALHLKNADGSDFDPTSSSQLTTYLKGATAVNMAYMLSAQLAAMQLNVLSGSVNSGSMIYAPNTPGANSLGYISISSLISEADSSLQQNPITTSGSGARGTQEALKNALDTANNNLNFVQSSPANCPFTFV